MQGVLSSTRSGVGRIANLDHPLKHKATRSETQFIDQLGAQDMLYSRVHNVHAFNASSTSLPSFGLAVERFS